MSTAFESIKQGLQEAIAHAQGDERGVRVQRPREIDVKAVRAKVGMTQEQFAARFASPRPPCALGARRPHSPRPGAGAAERHRAQSASRHRSIGLMRRATYTTYPMLNGPRTSGFRCK